MELFLFTASHYQRRRTTIPRNNNFQLITNFNDNTELAQARVEKSKNLPTQCGLGSCDLQRPLRKMGGTIWVNSEVGKGSTFSFTFQAEETAASQLVPKLDSITMGNRELAKMIPLKVLIAEDNRTNQLVAKGLLEKLGINPTSPTTDWRYLFE